MTSHWKTWCLALLLFVSSNAAVPARAEEWEAASTTQEPAGVEEFEGWDATPCGRRYVRADALFLTYGSGRDDQPIIIRTFDANLNYPGPALLTTGDVGLGTQIAPRITIGWLNEECRGWEASYFGLFGGGGSRTLVGNNDLALPGDLGLASLNFFGADQMTATSQGELQSFELNRQWWADDWTLLAGFRYLRITDQLNIRGGDPDTTYGDYHLDADNNLYGIQGGLRRTGMIGEATWDLTGKAGLFGTSARQHQFVTDDPNPNPVFYLRDPVGANGSEVSFVGELSANLTIPLTSWLSFRGGYNLLWVEGIALARNQLDFSYTASSGTGLSTGGGLFLHGAHVGLEASW